MKSNIDILIGLYTKNLYTISYHYAAVTPSRNSPSHRSHVKHLFAKLSRTWLSRDSYGVYVAITGSTWKIRGVRPALLFLVKIFLSGSYGTCNLR